MTYRVRNIGIAVALAAVAALLTSFYVTSYKRHVQRGEDQVTVLVAKHDIAEGTPGNEAAHALVSEHVPRRSVVPGAISSRDQIQGLVATQKTLEGEQITTRRFSPVAERGPRADLKGNLRAMQVEGDVNQTLAGILRDGDHVDVVATFKYHFANSSSQDNFSASRVVLRDLKVLKAPSGPPVGSKLTSGLQDHFSVLLAVTDQQAQKLNFVTTTTGGDATNGVGWSLQLRPVVHAADSPESVTTLGTVLRDGLSKEQLKRFFGDFGGGQ
ncbi:MAG TPA: Flp pilus assembly protein CpaB [Gaiellaceae bacterium]|jgi:Flp pilus assembly protein CpaB|nr:Flp pilus assembly protein CpaB [Gaiellaceae bacterium]